MYIIQIKRGSLDICLQNILKQTECKMMCLPFLFSIVFTVAIQVCFPEITFSLASLVIIIEFYVRSMFKFLHFSEMFFQRMY